jgi:hypothetical protein
MELIKKKEWQDSKMVTRGRKLDTPGRKNHQDKAKLQHLCSPSPRIACSRHVKWRNKEGSCTTRCQLLSCWGDHQNYYSDTNTRTGCWRTSTKSIKTESLLHLNLGNFIYLFIFIILSFLCLSNACLAHCWLVQYLSLLLFCFGFFPFFFTFFAFPLLSPFHSRYHHRYYYKLDNTELHTIQGQ